MKKIFIYGVAAMMLLSLLITLCGCSKNSGGDSYMQISVNDAIEMMETEKDYIILDVRTIAEYKEGHIPGAICVPNEAINENTIKELPEKEQLIFVYCRSGNRSKQAAAKLAKQGYTKVYEFGGIIDWTGEIVSENS
ncbi:MAG: rhodanese-like domain-containing protein [Lachnospiraceae bacterium]|nr:rhodanese-like domain-containing protein [Lachnospiraceae bacterium]